MPANETNRGSLHMRVHTRAARATHSRESDGEISVWPRRRLISTLLARISTWRPLALLTHELIEECRELGIRIEWEDIRDVLVRAHDDHATLIPIDATYLENVVAAFQVGTEHLLVAAQAEAPLSGQKNDRHRLEGHVWT